MPEGQERGMPPSETTDERRNPTATGSTRRSTSATSGARACRGPSRTAGEGPRSRRQCPDKPETKTASRTRTAARTISQARSPSSPRHLRHPFATAKASSAGRRAACWIARSRCQELRDSGRISGHTKPGTATRTSPCRRRARAVKAYLVGRGSDASRSRTRGRPDDRSPEQDQRGPHRTPHRVQAPL